MNRFVKYACKVLGGSSSFKYYGLNSELNRLFRKYFNLLHTNVDRFAHNVIIKNQVLIPRHPETQQAVETKLKSDSLGGFKSAVCNTITKLFHTSSLKAVQI